MTYQPHIDGIRAIAVLSVIFFHLGIGDFSGGYVGVDIFFVISGYLISSIIIKEYTKTNAFNFKNFYIRRARRLLPTLFATLLLTTLAATTLFTSEQLSKFGWELFSGSLSLSNIYFWGQSGYFDTASESKPLLHLWSLSVEEQFYLIWPLSLYLGCRLLKGNKLIWFIFALLILNLATTVLLTENEIADFYNQSAALFFLTPFRAYEFLIGVLAIWLGRKTPKSQIFHEALFILGIVGVAFSITSFDSKTVFPSYNALLPCVSALLLIVAKESVLCKIVLANKVSVFIGLISYALYLVHWPIFVFVKHIRFTELLPIDIVISVITTFVSAILIYFYIERPLRINKNKDRSSSPKPLTHRPFIKACISVTSAFCIIGLAITLTDGLSFANKKELYSQKTIQAGKAARYKLTDVACRITNLDSSNCDLNKPTQILVFGNSHEVDGYNIFHRIIENNTEANLILFGSTNFCEIEISSNNQIYSSTKRNTCESRVDILSQHDLIQSLDVVVFNSNMPFTPNKKGSYTTLNYLQKINPKIKVAVIGTYYNTVKECSQISNRYGSNDHCKQAHLVSYSGLNETQKIYNKELVDSLDYIYLDKFHALCSNGKEDIDSCPTEANGEPMFYDQHHLSLGFALHVGDRFSQVYKKELANLGVLMNESSED